MLKITTIELLTAAPVVQQLTAQKTTGAAALHILRLALKLGPEVRSASAARDTMLTEENSDIIEGGARRIRPEHLAAFMASPLWSEVIEIAGAPLTLADLADARLSADDLGQLGPLFVDEEGE